MRVLFADDDLASRTFVAAVLDELGHDAQVVEDGQQAWDAYVADPMPLVILDIRMPGIDGLELCRRIRQRDTERATFVLVITAYDGPGDLRAVLEAGADDYIAKPSSPKSLSARIEIAERRVRQALALRAAESDLARARWLAGIGETALAMEREISEPLETILERSRLLLEDDSFNAEQREQLAVIREQGLRLSGVVGRAVNLESPHSVEYLGGARMIDLSGDESASTNPPTAEPPAKGTRGE